MWSVQCSLCIVHFAMQCELSIMHHLLCLVHCALCTSLPVAVCITKLLMPSTICYFHIQPLHRYASKLSVILIEQAAWRLSHWKVARKPPLHCWMSWPALNKGNLLQPSSASTRESENSWQGLWLQCLLRTRRLTWGVSESMRLSTHSV